jgi:hypothetical protein
MKWCSRRGRALPCRPTANPAGHSSPTPALKTLVHGVRIHRAPGMVQHRSSRPVRGSRVSRVCIAFRTASELRKASVNARKETSWTKAETDTADGTRSTRRHRAKPALRGRATSRDRRNRPAASQGTSNDASTSLQWCGTRDRESIACEVARDAAVLQV